MSVIKYDPMKEWNEREHPNTDPNAALSIEEECFFGPLIANQSRILEIGPGVGRLFPLYKDAISIDTIDITNRHRLRVHEAGKEKAGKIVRQMYLNSVDSVFPYQDHSFDIGISSFVFIHIPFENIQHTMKEMARVCKLVAVVVASHSSWPVKGTNFDPVWHCFTHDYEEICRSNGFTFHKTEFDSNSFGFTYGR